MTDNFVFRREWREALKGCSAEVRTEVYDAIMAYAFEGEVVELSPLASMAFAFIKMQIDSMRELYQKKCDRNREKANRRWGKDSAESENMPAYAEPCQRMPSHANVCQSMPSDAKPCNQLNSTQIKSNNNKSLSLSPSPDGERGEDGLTAQERERIFEIFYFERNLTDAQSEFRKFCNHYAANGWCRANSSVPIKNKQALAQSWKVERDKPRWPAGVTAWLYEVYKKARADGREAQLIISGIERIMEEDGKVIILCQRAAAELCNLYSTTTKRDFELGYRCRREA